MANPAQVRATPAPIHPRQELQVNIDLAIRTKDPLPGRPDPHHIGLASPGRIPTIEQVDVGVPLGMVIAAGVRPRISVGEAVQWA